MKKLSLFKFMAIFAILIVNSAYAEEENKTTESQQNLNGLPTSPLGSRRGLLQKEATQNDSSSVGDMLRNLKGSSEDGIGTPAKGSLKAPPAREIDMGSGPVVSGRSEQEIMEIVNKHKSGLNDLYDMYLKKNPNFNGKVTLKFTIASSGDVVSIDIKESTTDYPEFDNAVKNRVATWKWKAIKSGNTTATIPFNFEEICNKDCKDTLKKAAKGAVTILKILLL